MASAIASLSTWMLHSLRFRLVMAMIAIPVLALVSVGITMTYANRDRVEQGLRFSVVPESQGGHGGPRPADGEDDGVPRRTEEDAIKLGNVRVFYDAETGQGYLVHSEPGFLTAYRKDRENVIHSLNRQLGVAIAVVSVVAAIIAFGLSRRIVKPVESLRAAAREMEAGNLAHRVPIRSRDEIAQLGQAFNAMAASLERNETLRKTMTSDIAHELRTPLNNVSGYLEAIADGVVEPDEHTIASLQEEADLLIRLVADLEQLSLADSGYQQLLFEDLDMNDIVSTAVELIAARAASKGITVRALPSPAAPVVADHVRMAQVVRNLLENAVRHTPAGGAVTVSLGVSNGHVELAVTDTGPGIPEEHLPNIFERFYRADPSRARATGGAGLGLAIVRQLVQAHGGTVQAGNGPAGGARFVVALPIAPAGTTPNREPLPVRTPSPHPAPLQ